MAKALLLCHFDIILDGRMCWAAHSLFIAVSFSFKVLLVFNSYQISYYIAIFHCYIASF